MDNVDFELDDDNELGCIITTYGQLFHDRFQNSQVEFNESKLMRSLTN